LQEHYDDAVSSKERAEFDLEQDQRELVQLEALSQALKDKFIPQAQADKTITENWMRSNMKEIKRIGGVDAKEEIENFKANNDWVERSK
jgi:hypothetical protein